MPKRNSTKDEFLKAYEELCVEHGMFINFGPNTRLEPNPNEKGNETTKEWSWFAFLRDGIEKLKKA